MHPRPPPLKVVYLKQEAESRKARTWQRRTVWRSWVAPLHLIRNAVYWDLQRFADVVVTVQRTADGELRASAAAGRRRRPRWVLWLKNRYLIAAACAAWILLGWPRDDTPEVAAYLARVLLAFLLVIVNAVLY